MGTKLKKTYWHIPIAFLTTVAVVFLVTALMGQGLLATHRLRGGVGRLLLTIVLGVYAAVLAERMVNARRHAKVRRFYWRLYSLLFIGQLVMGLVISSAWLAGAAPRLPHPFFMFLQNMGQGGAPHLVFLWAISIILTGPAFCAHLCWMGSWDQFAAGTKKRPSLAPSWRIRLGWAVIVMGTGLALISFAPAKAAATFGFVWTLGALFIMVIVSRRRGVMYHCTHYCPLGTITSILARISPFRIIKRSGKRLPEGVCKYGLFAGNGQKKGNLGGDCTLCGDCLDKGDSLDLRMRFLWFKFNAWPLFIAITMGLHGAFVALFTP